MKLYNKTKCPDEILRPLLVAAGKSVGARTSKVIVKVTQAQRHHSRGKAYKIPLVYSWHLRRLKNRKNEGRLIWTDGGYFEISLPAKGTEERLNLYGGAYRVAGRFYELAQHEWAHIKDYQANRHMPMPRTPSGRRVRWEDRPCEVAAMNSVEDANKIKKTETLIAKLAEYLKAVWQSSVGLF